MDTAKTVDVTITLDQIKGAHYLLGRFNQQNDQLTDIRVIDGKTKVPQSNDLTRYHLIGTGEGLNVEGMPLDQFVGEKCNGWDGTSPIKLSFYRNNGAFTSWAPAETSTAAGAA